MGEQTFNFAEFLMKFITEQTALPDMRLTDKAHIKQTVARLFENDELTMQILGVKSADEEAQCAELFNNSQSILRAIMEANLEKESYCDEVHDAFKRTLGYHVAVYAGLLDEYASLYIQDVDNDQIIEEAMKLTRVATEQLSVGKNGNGDLIVLDFWNLEKLDPANGVKYFSRSAIVGSITKYTKTLELALEKEAKAEEKAQKEAEKAAEQPDNEKELLERWRNANWTGIESSVDSLMATLETLYKSGIESLPAVGILINNGPSKSPLISAKTIKKGDDLKSDIVNEIDTGSAFDLDIMTVIAKHLDSLNYMEDIDPKTGFPTYEALLSNKGTMRNAHLMFQTASIPFSGRDDNKNSIRKWISATKDMSSDEWLKQNNNGKVTTLCRWSDVKDWYRWVIENTLFRYFTAAGLVPESQDLSDSKRTREIANIFIKKLKNVVSVSERVNNKSRMETTELKLTTDKLLDIDLIASEIAAILNTGNAKDITCKGRVLANQVYALTIVYDQKAANKATKFAYEVIDAILASGNTPSWDNVLIGRKQSGDLLFWDFMHPGDAASCSYAIYAGSGAGKGNMTLTLMAAALADGKQLFYTDGKPDSGGSIAALAWKDKKEAYMFDGQPKGTGSSFPGILEEHPVVNGMRSLAEVTQYTSSIPIGIFSEHEATMFLGTCRYLRSLQLCVEILNARGASRLPKDEWQVWVFDEMTAMSENEREIRKAMGAYIARKGYGNCFTLTKASKDNPKNSNVLIAAKEGEKLEEAKQADAGIAYIYDWLTWSSSIVSQVPNLVKIGLRQANANIFLIFQKADWLSEHGGITAISMFATALDCLKIVGANGLAPQCGQYGNGYTMNSSWYKDYVAKGNGWWAMSHSSDLGKAYGDSDVTIIKPYSIWGYRKAGDTTSPKERFFDYYVDKLSVVCRRPVSETLQSAYDYATSAIQSLAEEGRVIPADTVKNFIYNVDTFSVIGSDFDPSTLYDKLKESGIETAASHTDDYNNPVSAEPTTAETPIVETEPIVEDPTSGPMGWGTDEDEEWGADDSVSEVETASEPVETPITPSPLDFERKNDGFDDAREEAARQRAEQQAMLEELRRKAASSSIPENTEPVAPTPRPGMTQNELTERLKAMQGLQVDERQRALMKLGEELAAAGFDIHPNMPIVSKDEAEKAGTVTAHDTAELFLRDKDGKRLVDASNIPDSSKKVLQEGKGGNYMNFPHPVLANSFFESNNTKKLEKAKAKAWKDFINRLINAIGGRNTIMNISLSSNEIIVNGKLIEHGFMENTYITSLEQVADLKWTLEQFPQLSVLALTQDMLTALLVHTDGMYENPDSKKTNCTFEEYVFLSLCPKLNKFIINTTPARSMTRAQFLETRKARKKQQSALYKAAKQSNEARKAIGNVKTQFVKRNGAKYHLSDTQSRYKAAQVKYKFGFIGRGLYNFFDWISPND